MANTYLLEVGVEEMPAHVVTPSIKQLHERVEKYLKEQRITFDDIQEFLDENDIPYTPSVQFVGTSGYTHNYEFALPKMRGKPERLCKALNNPSKEKIESILFAWQDTQPVRPSESKLIIFMNDQKKISKDIYTALNNYNVSPIDWSKRFQVDVMNILRAG